MKITVEHYDKKYSVEMSDDSDIDEVMSQFENMAYLITFMPHTIEKWIVERAEEIQENVK